MNDKLRYFGLTALLGLLVAGSSAYAQTSSIVGSKHDFTLGGTAQGRTGATDQVCVFCHTPHGADTTAPVPLWNKVLNSEQTRFTRYSTLSTPSFDSLEAPVGSVSLACLSCHDGTQAMDVVLNSPGSGGYNPAGAEIDDVAIGVMTGEPVPMLGEDLSNDHPVSMQYAGGGPVASDPEGTFPRANLGDTDFFPPEKANINNQSIWWVDSAVGTAGTREKTDMLLYTRSDLGTAQPFVECGSCHDPHNSNTFGNQVSFLRTSNAESAVCTACHDK